MIASSPETLAMVSVVDPSYGRSFGSSFGGMGSGSRFDVLYYERTECRVNRARYQFRSPIRMTFYPFVEGSTGLLAVAPSLVGITARGTSLESAWKDWVDQFHVLFQTLSGMRHWERKPDEQQRWEQIEQMVDTAAFQRETPYVIRQIGEVSNRRPIPDRVRWEDGRTERVSLAQMPPEFATLHEGQRFEAEVLRHPVTDRLIEGLVVRKLPPLTKTSAHDSLWATLPTTRDLPDVDWDEFN